MPPLPHSGDHTGRTAAAPSDRDGGRPAAGARADVQISAVLVNYNAGPDLARALESIAGDRRGARWEAVVVDNASVDDSATVAERFGPPVRVIRNPQNVGFGSGVNQGVRASTGELILVMNPDCRLLPGAISEMAAVLAAHPECAVAGPRVLDPDGSVQGSVRGDPDMLTGLFGRTSRLRRLLPWLPVAKRNVVAAESLPRDAGSVVVDWVSGACMLMRRDYFESVGGFDERYFLYWEDADLCRRLRARGWHVRYVPAASVVHRVGQSSRTARAASVRAFHASAYRYYATHVAPGALSPRRLLARVLLSVRCWLAMRQIRF